MFKDFNFDTVKNKETLVSLAAGAVAFTAVMAVKKGVELIVSKIAKKKEIEVIPVTVEENPETETVSEEANE